MVSERAPPVCLRASSSEAVSCLLDSKRMNAGASAKTVCLTRSPAPVFQVPALVCHENFPRLDHHRAEGAANVIWVSPDAVLPLTFR